MLLVRDRTTPQVHQGQGQKQKPLPGSRPGVQSRRLLRRSSPWPGALLPPCEPGFLQRSTRALYVSLGPKPDAEAPNFDKRGRRYFPLGNSALEVWLVHPK